MIFSFIKCKLSNLSLNIVQCLVWAISKVGIKVEFVIKVRALNRCLVCLLCLDVHDEKSNGTLCDVVRCKEMRREAKERRGKRRKEKEREGKRREGKGREEKRREEKGREEKGREEKRDG